MLSVTNNPIMLGVVMLNVGNSPFMLDVVMLGVVMLSVVAPLQISLSRFSIKKFPR